MKDLVILGGFFSGLVATTSLMTVFWAHNNGVGRFQSEPLAVESTGTRFGNLMSAHDTCDKNIRQRFDNILSKHYDDLSSRFDERRQTFLVFANVSVGKTIDSATHYRVICTVNQNNQLARMESIVPGRSSNTRYQAAFGQRR